MLGGQVKRGGPSFPLLSVTAPRRAAKRRRQSVRVLGRNAGKLSRLRAAVGSSDSAAILNWCVCVCEVTTLDSSASASRMGQTGSTRSYLASTAARCRKDRKAQGPEKDRTKYWLLSKSWLSSPAASAARPLQQSRSCRGARRRRLDLPMRCLRRLDDARLQTPCGLSCAAQRVPRMHGAASWCMDASNVFRGSRLDVSVGGVQQWSFLFMLFCIAT
eukprot:366142-Chlamydomonas_euryale.AAC.2